MKSAARKRQMQKRLYRILLLFLVFLTLCFSFFWADSRLFVVAKDLSAIKAKSIVNQQINTSLQEMIAQEDLSSFLQLNAEYGLVSADTLKINAFCSQLSDKLETAFSQTALESVGVPLGSLCPIAFFQNIGPKLNYYFAPTGTVQVEYETAFLSGGINQVNLQIWLIIQPEIRILHLFQEDTVQFSRKILLIDTVINGKVPEALLQNQ